MSQVEYDLEREDGTTWHMLLEISVSGRYRPAFINGDPDVCREAEYPEIEVTDYLLLGLTDAEGNERILNTPQTLTAFELTRAEMRKIDRFAERCVQSWGL